jgi:predicted 2-oxoglutarate/Fe(II)-dependent dioxygenase YbiX/peroxiredoxin
VTQNKPLPGDYAPWFNLPALAGNPSYAFDSTAGRHVLLLFFGSAKHAPCAEALRLIEQNRPLFDDMRACFFGVTIDPADEASGTIAPQIPGIRYFLDYDRKVSALYGADLDGRYDPYWLVLDRRLCVLGRFPVDRGAEAIRCLKADLARVDEAALWAPALLVPGVFEPDLCRHLIGLYDADGGHESGFMRDVDGKTRGILDPSFKQRRDYLVEDEALRKALAARVRRRLLPSLQRAFAFEATRIERYLVACYEAGAGYFRPHRDNTTMGTAHRRFAVTINLNAEEYEGGDLRFPEYGSRSYRAPTGGAVIFSCSLLHEAMPVTKGRRYAFLPFLYDEPAAKIRSENLRFLEGSEAEKAEARAAEARTETESEAART